jgi:hypothetical protein
MGTNLGKVSPMVGTEEPGVYRSGDWTDPCTVLYGPGAGAERRDDGSRPWRVS